MSDVLQNVIVRKATFADLPAINGLVKSNNWTVPRSFNVTFFRIDPDGLMVAELIDAAKNNATITGCLSVFNINDEISFVGQYFVDNRFRKKGIVYAIWKQLMVRVGDRNVALFA